MFLTVVIPTFNMGHCIKKTLNSLQNQTYQNFEVLIVDDGSTDNTKQIIMPFIHRNPTGKYFAKDNGHGGSVINYVIKHNLISGDYVTILDADDGYVPHAFQLVCQKIKKHPQIDFLITDSYNGFKKKQRKRRIFNAPFGSRFISAKKAINPGVRQLGKFYQRQLFTSLPLLQEKIDFNDAYMQAFFANKAQHIYYFARPLSYYWSDHHQSLTRGQDSPSYKNWLELFSMYEKADKISEENREVAAIFLMNLGYFRRKLTLFSKENYLPRVKIKTKGIKFQGLPGFARILPLKIFFKFKTRKGGEERET